MKHKALRAGLALTLAALVSSGAVAGQWSTSYGALTLPDQPSGNVRAPYTDDSGRVIGRFLQPKCMGCGVVLTGIWVEAGSAKTCPTKEDGSSHWGTVQFEFNPEFTSFTGRWGYCDEPFGHDWSGRLGATRILRHTSK